MKLDGELFLRINETDANAIVVFSFANCERVAGLLYADGRVDDLANLIDLESGHFF